jgi:ADP-ribosylation factor GTPase-activating protein 1
VDKWSEAQAKRMNIGGNDLAIEFFKTHPDYKDGMNINDKYDSEFGSFYKDKLSCLLEGKEYVQPPIGSRKKVAVVKPTTKNLSHQDGSIYAPNNSKERNENYFAKMGEDNLSRPDNLHPSQGGKFAGFGSGF